MDGHPRGRARADQVGAGNNLSFAVEPLTITSVPADMMQAHYEESAKFKGVLKLHPNWGEYLGMQAKGELVFVVARINTFVVGYMVIVVKPHLHYVDVKLAVDDLHYLMPEYRGQGWGKSMIMFAEKAARQAGATVFSMRCKAAQNHGYIFESLGYELTDLVYVKDLTHG
jgi:GNAT superfamily N-acetyltransferase